jgi:hypothetical protein
MMLRGGSSAPEWRWNMLVKCKCHDKPIDRDIAYKVNVRGTNHYYCSEADYNRIVEDKRIKDTLYQNIYQLFGYKVTNTVLYKEVGEIANDYSYGLIKDFIDHNSDRFDMFVRKEFGSEYSKIRYFTAILKNNLRDFKKTLQSLEQPKNTFVEIVETPKYQQRSRRRPLDEYMDGDDE